MLPLTLRKLQEKPSYQRVKDDVVIQAAALHNKQTQFYL